MNTIPKKPFHILIALVCSVSLGACGGGGSADASASGPASVIASSVVTTTSPDAVSTSLLGTLTAVGNGSSSSVPVKVPTATTSVNGITTLTDVTMLNPGKGDQSQVPVTFGQVFAKGAVQPNVEIIGLLADGTNVPLQIDSKATHGDGSLRHAIISAVLPKLKSGQSVVITMKNSATTRTAQTLAPASLLKAGFSAGVTLKVKGETYSVSASDLLKSGKYTTWLSGALVNEWHVSAPLKTSAGVEHPHLAARFAIRSYTGLDKARVDVSIENDWAYEPNPGNITYDAAITVGGKTAFEKLGMTQLHHTRWRQLVWWGTTPEVHVMHNSAYLMATRALPNYDQSIQFSDGLLNDLKAQFSANSGEPMSLGLSVQYMPTTGGRPDIGLLPGWAATYLLTMDKRAKDVTLGTADLAGSYSSHFRDKNTDRPISLFDYPYMTIIDPHVGDTYNPATGKYEAFPACNNCESPNVFDVAHQPGYAYLPYLVTGDYYYLEELYFWTMANAFNGHPGYREGIKGLMIAEQTRGQAWTLRTLSEAAYITPDADRFKKQFETILENNLNWYNAQYSNNSAANALGILTESIGYSNNTAMAPWQDDFFTSAAGHAAELGFDKAATLMLWKAKFPISRMTGDGVCWIDAAPYNLTVRKTESSTIFNDIGTAYRATHASDFNSLACNSAAMATALGTRIGEMTGAAGSPVGNPATMQPALAFATNASPLTGVPAWKLFMSRSVKPDYSQGPQFAIVPR